MTDKATRMQDIIRHIEAAMNLVDDYVPSRPQQKVFDNLEDAILWTQVLVNTIPLKAPPIEDGVTCTLDVNEDEQKKENEVDAA